MKRQNGSPGPPYVELADVPQHRVTWRLMLSILAAWMGSFQFGYNTGVINNPEKDIKAFINRSEIWRTGTAYTNSDLRPLWALLVSIYAVGGIVGALVTNVWSEKFGRKNGMSINSWIGVAAAGMMFASYYARAFEMIIVGRLIIGFHCGLYTGLVPVYLSEIAYSRVRGALGTAHQFGVTVGIIFSQILSFPEILGNNLWYILLGLTAFPALFQFVLFLFCPRSPKFLLLQRQDRVAAIHALQQLRGTDDVAEELAEIYEEGREHVHEKQLSIWGLLKSRSLRWSLTIAVVMHLSQQLSGINAIVYYSASLFEQAGLSLNSAQHATVAVGGIMVVMTIVSIPLMDSAGRRPLHLYGLVGMLVASVFVTLCLVFSYKASWVKIATIVFLLLFVVAFSVGPGSIPWLIVSELFTYGSRSAAVSIATFVNWASNFIIGFAFPYMTYGLKNYSFLPFTVTILIFTIFVAKYLPETKNRSCRAIASDLGTVNSCDTNETSLLVDNAS